LFARLARKVLPRNGNTAEQEYNIGELYENIYEQNKALA
jgi:hypothetical protein